MTQTPSPDLPVRVADEVSDAIASGTGVVALESTLLSHGLPADSSAQTARQIEDAVRREGAVPATLAVVDGELHVGLSDEALERVAGEPAVVVKASIRDLSVVMARGLTAATTVAATSYLALAQGISVFATGGLGGVHRGSRETWDESADLAALGSLPITVVCAGVKSILDVSATLERLESLSVTVLGYRTDDFPGFYIRDSGLPVPWRADEPAEVGAVMQRRAVLGLSSGIVVANPVPRQHEMDRGLHEETLVAGLASAESAGVRGKDVTPYLLAFFHEHTQGASLAANVGLVVDNAALAARIVCASGRERLTARGRS
jgi:pseudouridine-5'-phosphate glycosidase